LSDGDISDCGNSNHLNTKWDSTALNCSDSSIFNYSSSVQCDAESSSVDTESISDSTESSSVDAESLSGSNESFLVDTESLSDSNESSSVDAESLPDCDEDEQSYQSNVNVDPSTSSSFDHQFSVALLSVVDKHSLSYSCVTDLLKLFTATVPNFSLCSAHMLLNKFTNFKESTRVHCCCGCCGKLLKADTKCTRSECLASGLPDSSFIEVRLDHQLQVLFTGKVKLRSFIVIMMCFC